MEYGDESTIVNVQEQVDSRPHWGLQPSGFRPRDVGVPYHVISDQSFVKLFVSEAFAKHTYPDRMGLQSITDRDWRFTRLRFIVRVQLRRNKGDTNKKGQNR